jgi:hypothetical protein
MSRLVFTDDGAELIRDSARTTGHPETIHFDVLRATRRSALGPRQIAVEERVLDDYLRQTP